MIDSHCIRSSVRTLVRGSLRPAVFHTVVFLVVIGSELMARNVAQAQVEAPDSTAVAELSKIIRWSGVLSSLVAIAMAWLALRFVRGTVERLSSQFTSKRLLLQKLGTIFQFLTYIGTALTVTVLSFRLDDKTLALIGGTVAVSTGFATKDLVASFLAGIIIMIDRPFQVGDRIAFGGEYGDITAIGLRSVRMQTLDDNVVTIPNNKFLNDITSSGNYGALDMQVAMDFYVGPDQDVLVARDIVHEAALTSRFVHLPKPIRILVTQVIQENHVAVRLRLKAYVLDTQHEKAFETDVNLRVLRAFRAKGILPPAILHRRYPASMKSGDGVMDS